MRDLKFRIWDKKEKEFTQDAYADIYKGKLELQLYEEEKYIIEQYTGLKDSEGKEIYEGDILQNNGIVEYKEEEGGGIEFGAKWIGFKQDEVDDFHKDKIIGNIHEHGNLLKDVKD